MLRPNKTSLLTHIGAAVAGSLSCYGFAPYGWFWLPIFTLAGLFGLWRAFPKQAAGLGWWYGMGYFLAGIRWIYISLHDYGGLSVTWAAAAITLFAALLALFPALAGWLYQRRLIRSAGGLAAAWMLQEWIRSWLFTGFPWLALGYSQVPNSPLSGYAPVAGVFGVSLLAALSASLLAQRKLRAMALIVLIFAAGVGLKRIAWTQPVGAPFSVSLLQGNIGQSSKWQPQELGNTLIAYERMVLASHARLIILPETAIPLFYDNVPPLYLNTLADYAREQGSDLLIGIPEHLTNARYFNSLMSFGTSPQQVYRKSHLVPFGEFIPLKPVFGHLLDFLDVPLSDFSRGGANQPPLQVAGQQVAADICYEDVFGDEIIHPLPTASVLVNVTNDAWFGHSAAAWQHEQMSQMRALETGRYMLRATNTGATAIINEHGVVVAQFPWFTRGTLNGLAQGYQGETPYVRFGNYPALILAVILWGLNWRRRICPKQEAS